MAKLPLNGKVWKAGEGFVITIPKLYIDNGWVKVGKKYRALLMSDEGNEEMGLLCSFEAVPEPMALAF